MRCPQLNNVCEWAVGCRTNAHGAFRERVVGAALDVFSGRYLLARGAAWLVAGWRGMKRMVASFGEDGRVAAGKIAGCRGGCGA